MAARKHHLPDNFAAVITSFALKSLNGKASGGWGCLVCISLVKPVTRAEPCKSWSGFVAGARAECAQHMLSISSKFLHKCWRV